MKEARRRPPSIESDAGSEAEAAEVRQWSKEEHTQFVELCTTRTVRVKRDGSQTTGLGPGIAELIALIVGPRRRASAVARSEALPAGAPRGGCVSTDLASAFVEHFITSEKGGVRCAGLWRVKMASFLASRNQRSSLRPGKGGSEVAWEGRTCSSPTKAVPSRASQDQHQS